MTQNELTYILAIAEYGTISKAAKELFISQPSLCQTLSKVETEFGEELFNRTSTGLVPTLFGRRYLKTAREILDCYLELMFQLDEVQKIYCGSITFGIPINLGSCLLPHVMPNFIEKYPNVTLRIRENNASELDKLLLTGKTDFSIMHYEKPNEAIYYEQLTHDPFYLVIPSSATHKYGFQEHQTITGAILQSLHKENFIMVSDRQYLRDAADLIFQKANFEPHIRLTTKSMGTAKRLVAKGCGITLLPSSYLQLFSDADGLTYYPLDDSLEASLELVVAYRKSSAISLCSREFINLLKEMIKTPQ